MRTVGAGDKIVEYNQEQCRVKNYTGGESLIRSFPSKVDVRRLLIRTDCMQTRVDIAHVHERRREGKRRRGDGTTRSQRVVQLRQSGFRCLAERRRLLGQSFALLGILNRIPAAA